MSYFLFLVPINEASMAERLEEGSSRTPACTSLYGIDGSRLTSDSRLSQQAADS